MFEDPPLPLVFSRQYAVRLGLTPDAVTWRGGPGGWQRLRRGAFCQAGVYDAASPEQRHLLHALAALATPSHRVETISHVTAAIASGWPGPLAAGGEVPWFTVEGKGSFSTRRRSGVVRQVAPLPSSQVVERFGLTLTSPARTVADCLRHYPPRVSIPIADAAIRDGLDPAELRRVLAGQEGWPYAARASRAARLVDGRRESWLESLSGVVFHELGLPMPRAQVTIRDERQRFVARVDFLWDGVVGEADGWAKYRAEGTDDTDGREVELADLRSLRREKEREDRLRDLGLDVVRWGTAEVLSPGPALRDRVLRALARAQPRRVRGSQRLEPMRLSRSVPAPRELAVLVGWSADGWLLPPPYSSSAGVIAS